MSSAFTNWLEYLKKKKKKNTISSLENIKPDVEQLISGR